MTTVAQFHNLSHIFISLIGACLLLALYYNIRTRFKHILEEEALSKRVDKGLLNLSLAMFIWVLSGMWAYIGFHFGFMDGFGYQGGVNLLSILNNMFLLFALSYFYDAPDFISNNDKNVKRILYVIIGVTLVTLGISYLVENNQFLNVKLTALPDLLLSGFLSVLLVISLYRTFVHRGLKVVATISVIVITLLFISQLPAVFTQLNDEYFYSLIRIIAKTSLIFLFLLLATTWVIQLANTPKITEMQIKFLDWSLVQLTIPSKNIEQENIDFGSKTTQYKNLLKFAIRRKYGDGDEQSILINIAGEIKNQTYLSRIIENINQILKIEGEDQLERRDIFTFLGEGKYRLRILPEHIVIDETLLSEFTKVSENQDYKSICN